MVVLTELRVLNGVDCGISGQGHAYVGLIVAFLVVARINTAVDRNTECRNYTGIMYREAREYSAYRKQFAAWRLELLC
jgi:predicted membrane chloride channel (bestrophin family)